MNTEYLESFSEEKGKEIAKILLKNYDAADFDLDPTKIEKEIHDISNCYSKILFFETKSFLSEESRKFAKSYVRSRFDVKEKESEKMGDIDLIAHWIKSEVINALGEEGMILL